MSVVFILLGIGAIVEPGIAGLAVAILVGWLLIFAGAAHLIATFRGGGARRVIWQVILGIIYIVGGIYFRTHPLLALGTLTLLLGAMITVQALLEFIVYFQTRSEGRSGWILVNGLISLSLGGLIWFHWPSSSVWAIGTLVGVNLLITGISRLMLGTAARKLVSRATA
ncbi:MAG: HdeD family acid-resistance protein [Blastocatellia bacterium]